MRQMKKAALLVMIFMIAVGLVMPAFSESAFAASKPAKVKSVRVKSVTTSGFTVKWKKAKRAVKYQIAYKKTGAKKWKYKTTGKKSYKVKKLRQGTKYSVKVRALRYSRKGKWSKTTKVVTKPEAVTDFYVSERTCDSLTLKWKKNTKAEKYVISCSDVNSGKTIARNTNGNVSEYKLTGLDESKRYYNIRVRPVCGSQYGAWTASCTAVTPRNGLVVNYYPKGSEFNYTINVFAADMDEMYLPEAVYFPGDDYDAEGYSIQPMLITEMAFVNGHLYMVGSKSPTDSNIVKIEQLSVSAECDSSGYPESCSLLIWGKTGDGANYRETQFWTVN